MEFPIISIKHLESDFDSISSKIFKASQEWGFFIVTDHGITGSSRMFTLVSWSNPIHLQSKALT